MITVQEAQTHYHESITGAEQQFHIHRGAGQLILHITRAPFEPEGVKIHEEIQRTSM